jgi:hypothetical protein
VAIEEEDMATVERESSGLDVVGSVLCEKWREMRADGVWQAEQQ